MSPCFDHAPYPCLTEEMIQNNDAMGQLAGWRRFRIEYGFECSCPEGVIYAPPDVDPEILERGLRTLILGWRWNPDLPDTVPS